MNDAVDRRVRASFACQSLMRSIEAELFEATPGRCRIGAPIPDWARQQHGAAHGGLTFALGDTAAGYAALTLLPEGREVMTAEMKINLMSPAVGDRLCATGEVVRSGRRLTVVRAQIEVLRDDTATTVAVLQGTMIAVDPPAG